MDKTKIQSLIRFGTAKATTGLAKNATVYAKHRKPKKAEWKSNVKVIKPSDVVLCLQPSGVVVKHRGLWSL